MKNMFNIYYINYEKATEISMLIDNKVLESITRTKGRETSAEGEGDVSTDPLANIPLIGKHVPSFSFDGTLSHSRSKQVEDTIKVVSTKSTMLRPLFERATEVKKLSDSKVGNLIKIKGVNLSVVNLSDVLAIKTLLNGLIKQIPVNDDNLDLTSIFPVLFKDSTYLIEGEFKQKGIKEKFIIKIPMNSEAELESNYSVSDLEIGDVTVIGIYRGKFDKKLILKKSNVMMALNNTTPIESNDDGSDIEDGSSEQPSDDSGKVHYIDVISIIQELNL
ncbi:MAG: hypothetical protein IJ060_09960 [Oscillospiraceae bacterium]|nr:hypothetical protein [Oscillospiraceae bacterium]